MHRVIYEDVLRNLLITALPVCFRYKQDNARIKIDTIQYAQ